MGWQRPAVSAATYEEMPREGDDQVGEGTGWSAGGRAAGPTPARAPPPACAWAAVSANLRLRRGVLSTRAHSG